MSSLNGRGSHFRVWDLWAVQNCARGLGISPEASSSTTKRLRKATARQSALELAITGCKLTLALWKSPPDALSDHDCVACDSAGLDWAQLSTSRDRCTGRGHERAILQLDGVGSELCRAVVRTERLFGPSTEMAAPTHLQACLAQAKSEPFLPEQLDQALDSWAKPQST